MPAALPVPVEFRLPNQRWRPADPDGLGVPDAAFLAVRSAPAGDYAPTLTLSGGLRSGATLDEIADESLALLAEQGSDAELVKRRELGTAEAPGVTQLLGATVHVDGRRWDLRQAQVLLALADERQTGRTFVLVATLTATYAELEAVLPEFQQFVATLRPVPPPA